MEGPDLEPIAIGDFGLLAPELPIIEDRPIGASRVADEHLALAPLDDRLDAADRLAGRTELAARIAPDHEPRPLDFDEPALGLADHHAQLNAARNLGRWGGIWEARAGEDIMNSAASRNNSEMG